MRQNPASRECVPSQTFSRLSLRAVPASDTGDTSLGVGILSKPVRTGKLAAILSICAFVFLVGCTAAGHDEDLIGSWIWVTDAAYALEFYYDGTGSRGFAETHNEFEWETRGERLNISRERTARQEITDEMWDFEIENGALTVVNANLPEQEITYTYVPAVYGNNPAFVGEWTWEDYPTFTLYFRSDGRGFRGFPGDDDYFGWLADDTRLVVRRDSPLYGEIRGELWEFALDGDILTITSLQEYDSVFTYVRN